MELRFVEMKDPIATVGAREFLSDLLNSKLETDRDDGAFLVEVILQLQRHVDGPVLLVSRSHWKSVCLSLENPIHVNLYVCIVPRGNAQATVNFPWTSPDTPLTGTLAFHVNGQVQTAIAVVFALQSLLKLECPSAAKIAYRNELPVAAVDSENERVQCPFCCFSFSVQNAHEWDGNKHLVCGQRLDVRIVRISELRKATREMGMNGAT